jgi:hypothetical protein
LWDKVWYNVNHLVSYVYNGWDLSLYQEWLKTYSNSSDNFVLKNTLDDWKIWAGHIYYLNWDIDEVRIYNRALSDTEIKTLYEATK